jgi:hypothetical protein
VHFGRTHLGIAGQFRSLKALQLVFVGQLFVVDAGDFDVDVDAVLEHFFFISQNSIFTINQAVKDLQKSLYKTSFYGIFVTRSILMKHYLLRRLKDVYRDFAVMECVPSSQNGKNSEEGDMTEERIVTLPDQWVTAAIFEQALQASRSISNSPPSINTKITFHFLPSCKIMVEAAVRLLSLANQLAATGVQVTFAFEGEQHEAMSYLNRANFFTLLSEQVQVVPKRPDPALAARFHGHSRNLVEFKAIHLKHYEFVDTVPTQLVDALEAATAARSDSKQLGQTAFTIFGELISNVYLHSQTELNGFAALQVYQQGRRVQVVVSDSGVGLLETLRPKLLSSAAKRLEDAELIRLLFRGDLAWDSHDKGQGLQECARRSLKHHGSVGIRLDTCGVYLSPSHNGYEAANAQYRQHLAPLKGTHICFSFPLDIPQ